MEKSLTKILCTVLISTGLVLLLFFAGCGGGGGGGVGGDGGDSDNTQILGLLTDLSALYASGTPSAAQIEPFFQPAYLNDGKYKSQEITEWTGGRNTGMLNWPPVGDNVSLLSVELLSSSPKTYRVEFLHTYPSGIRSIGNVTVVLDGTTWRLYGNQRVLSVVAASGIARGVSATVTETYSGIFPAANDAYNTAPSVQSIVVTGPGLPGGGLVLNRGASGGTFNYFPGLIDNELEMYTMSDSDISLVADNAAYTFTLKTGMGGTGSNVAVYVSKIYNRPPLSGAITDAMFPQLISPTSHALSAANYGGTLNVSWTNPTMQTTRQLALNFKTAQDGYDNWAIGPFGTNAWTFNSAGLGITPTKANLEVINMDLSKGWVVFYYWLFE